MYKRHTISLTAGDSWLPVETADFTLTDADANKDSGSADTLDIGDPYDRIPTITIGDPLTLGDNVKTTQSTTDGGNALTHEGVIIQSMTSDTAADAGDQYWYKTNWANTTDNSKRLNIIVDGVSSTNSIVQPEETSATKTWVNITTGIHPSQLVDLPGTTLISYDVTSLADQLSASDINVLMNMTGTTPEAWNNPTKGAELTKAQIDKGADVVYQAAGGTGIGVLQAAADAGIFGIGVDANQNYMHPGSVLTSMLKRVDVAVYNAFKSTMDGTYETGVFTLGLAEDGVGWALDEHNASLITDEMKTAVEQAKADIISGKIIVADASAQ
mgnify:CR=1 FL=1